MKVTQWYEFTITDKTGKVEIIARVKSPGLANLIYLYLLTVYNKSDYHLEVN